MAEETENLENQEVPAEESAEETQGGEPPVSREETPAEEPAPEQTKESPKEELERKVMQLRQKLQILEWDADRDQINPAKRFELEQLKKEFDDVKSQLDELEAKEKPKPDAKEEPEPEAVPKEEEKETFAEKVKDVVDKVERFLHLKKDDDDLFQDEVEALEEETPEFEGEETPEAEEEKEEAPEPETQEAPEPEKPVEEKQEEKTQSNESQ